MKRGKEQGENIPNLKFLGAVNTAPGWILGLFVWFWFFPPIEGKIWMFCYKVLFRKIQYLVFKRCFIVPRSVSVPDIHKQKPLGTGVFSW